MRGEHDGSSWSVGTRASGLEPDATNRRDSRRTQKHSFSPGTSAAPEDGASGAGDRCAQPGAHLPSKIHVTFALHKGARDYATVASTAGSHIYVRTTQSSV